MEAPLIIAGLVGLSFLIAMFALNSFAESRRDAKQWRARVQGETSGEAEPEVGAMASGLGYFRERARVTVERMGTFAQPKDKSEISALKKQLVTAGYRSENAAMMFLGVKMLLTITFPLIVMALPIKTLEELPALQLAVAYLLVAVVGLYAPQIWLSQAVKKRQQLVTEGFPDALDLLVVCVEAGLGLDAAVGRVGKELALVHPELSDEFGMLTLELRAGLPRQQTLQNLADRTDLDSVRSMTALLIQTDRFGTSIGQALRVYSDTMRKERALRAEELAAKLPVKLLFPLIFFIFPSLFIVILGPAVIQAVRILMPTLKG